MAWLALLVLMLIVSAAPGISIYLEHVRTGAVDAGDSLGDGSQRRA